MERCFYGITVDYFLDDSICVLLFPAPHWRVGVLFLVLYPLLPSPPPPACPQILTHTHLPHTYITQSHTASLHSTHTLTHITHSQSLAHTSLTDTSDTHHTLTHTYHSHTHPTHTQSCAHTITLTHAHTHITHTHTSQTQSLAHTSLTSLCRWLLRGRCGAWCSATGRMVWQVRAGGFCVPHHLVLCKGSDVRPGAPCSPPLCRWLLRGRCGIARHLVLCKRSDVRPGVPWSPLQAVGWRGRCGTWCSASGRMYALASLGLRRSAGAFAWQVRRLVLCKRSDGVAGAALGALQAVGCTPWRPLVSAS